MQVRPIQTTEPDRSPRGERAPRMLARTLYRDLRNEGFDERQIRALAAELEGLARDPRRG